MAERFFTASSSVLGTRMLSCASFFSNSNITGFKPERSYFDRSAVATNRSASASVLNVGIFFFIVPHFLFVHIPCANRTDKPFPGPLTDRKNQKDGSPACGLADRPKTLLG